MRTQHAMSGVGAPGDERRDNRGHEIQLVAQEAALVIREGHVEFTFDALPSEPKRVERRPA